MKTKIFTALFLIFILSSSVFSQTVNVTIVYNGAQGLGCCDVCGTDYTCINNIGGCGTNAPCLNRTFSDPVPAGNIITGVTVSDFAVCGGSSPVSNVSSSINGVAIGTTAVQGGCQCGGCNNQVMANTFPCPTGLSSYNYGGNNTFRLCPNGDYCIQRAVITFTYTPVSIAPTAATANPNPSCGGAVTLNKVGGSLGFGAVWKWYSGSCGGVLEGTGASIVVTPSATTTYFIRAEGGGCGTTPCVSVTVTMNTPSTAPVSATATPAVTCGGATTLNVTGGSLGTGASWKWYSGSCGGVFEGTGSTLSVSPSVNTTYYVRAEGTCNTTLCVSVAVTVNPVPFAIATPSSAAFCSGGTTAIALSSFTPGTTFAWTISPSGITGASAGSGASIAQTLTNSGASPDSVVYTITPTANSCIGTPINVRVVVNPVPVASITPAGAQTICAGIVLGLALNSNAAGTTFTWTVVLTNAAGGHNGSGTAITDTLTATGGGSGTAIYTITPTANGCPGIPISDTITVNPDPGATAAASPIVSTICSGTTTSISLTSVAIGTIFTWTVTQTGANGATPGTGATIAQTLTTGTIPSTVVYTITATANGCTGNQITSTLTVNPIPVLTATPASQTFCSGGTTGIALSSNTAGTTYFWSASETGVTGAVFGSDTSIVQTLSTTGITGGTAVYTITPTANGCSGNAVNVTITVNHRDNASFVYSSATYCLSGNNPTPIITGLPGGVFSAVPAGLLINSATGTINLAGSSLGSYTLTYRTNGICPDSSSITMTIDNSTPFANFTYPASPYCQNGTDPFPVFGTGASAGVFTVTPIGLVFDHINTGQIDLSASAPGTYTVTNHIPASGNCDPVVASSTVTITVADNASFVYTSATYCQSGTPQTPVVTGIPGGVFSAVPAGLAINPSTGTITLSGSAWGSYTLSYLTNGPCPNTSSITMTIDSITPSAIFTYGAASYCQNANDPSPIFGSGASAGIYSATPAGLVFVHVNTGQIDLSASAPGTYTVTNTIPASGSCLALTATTTVVISPSDNASFSYTSATYCQSGTNQTPSITGLPGGVFSAVPPGLVINSATGIINLAASAVGSYTLTYTTNGSCSNSSSIIMTIDNTTPFANFSYAGSPFCQNTGNPYPSFGPGASAGIFSAVPAGLVFVHVNTGQINLSASAPGTYTVTNTIPASGSCQAVIATTTIVINPADNASFFYPSATYCISGTPQTPTITGLPGGVFSAVPAGLSINPATGTITLSTCTLGAYTLSYTTNGNCPDTSSITMTITNTTPLPDFTYSGSPFCQSGIDPYPIFSAGASAGIFSAVPSGLVFDHVNTGQIDLSLSAPGTYTVTNNIPASGTCSAVSHTYTVIINQAPTAIATPSSQSFCTIGTTPVPLTIALTSNIPGTTFSWTVTHSGLNGVTPGSGSSITQTISLTGAGQGTASYTITPNANGCVGAPTIITVTVNPKPVIDTVALVILPANCGTATGAITGITNVSGQAPLTYQWKDSLGNPVGNSIDLNNVIPGRYTLTVTDGNNCTVSAGPVILPSTTAVFAAFTPNPSTGETPLTVNFTNNSSGATHYIWQFGDGLNDTSSALNPSHVYLPLGKFTVCLTAISAANCIDTACSKIDIYLNSVFVIPNIFTPNGDNINDMFTVKAIGLKTMDAQIFNRWGEKMYEWHTTNGGWDGYTASGVAASEGTYYFIIKASGIDGKEYFEKGNFSLIRGK